MTERVRIAFLDVDHTVLRRSSGRHFLLLGVRQGLFPVFSLFYLPLAYVCYWFGRLGSGSLSWELPILRGKTRAELEELAERSQPYLEKEIFPQARTLIAELRASGRRVVFATSSLDLLVRPLARHLELDDLLASRLEFVDDVATGRFVGAPLLKEEKKRRVLEYIRDRGALPQDCRFYSDSIQDLPSLDAVGEAVAVNPDPRLAHAARRRGWPILRF
jgi:HAD superfamily hydrolase (TIGR01490 family)